MYTSTDQALMQGAFYETGSVEPGKLGDLTVLRVEGEPGKYRVEIGKTIVAGKVFYPS